MRINKNTEANELKLKIKQEKKDKITRIIAIIFVFAGVYYFFIKLIFL